MRINAIKTEIDKRKLQQAIYEFEVINNKSAYLFMSEDTMDAITINIAKECKSLIPTLHDMKELGRLSEYQGNKCYVNNDLVFGEVEIR